MLTSRAKNTLIDKINTAFSAIGRTLPAKASDNREPCAYEYFIASHLYKIAEGRRKAAQKDAIAANVIFDTDDEANRRPGGTQETVYNGDLVTVMLSVSKPRVTVDVKALAAFLVDHKVKQSLIDEAIQHASKEAKAGHQFTAALVTGDASGK